MPGAQHIMVSGGSRGLGAAIVKQLLEAGHHVATFSRRPSPAIETWQADASLAERFCYAQLDAQDSSALTHYFHDVVERFTAVDVLINNAGIGIDGVLATADDDSIQMLLNVNLSAAICLSREAARHMLLRERGVMINVASIAGLRGASGLSVYSATKAGVIGLTRSLARELGPKGIRVNAIAPGYLETEMAEGLTPKQRETIIRRTPLGRLGCLEDVVPVVEFLLSDAAQFITGQVISIDGGASV